MKRIFAIALAAMMALCLCVSVFADYDEPFTMGLYVGGWGDVGTVVVDKPGTYTITASKIDSSDWIIIKNAAGETVPTSVPAGTVIRVTSLVINGTAVTFDSGDVYDYVVPADQTIENIIYLSPSFGGSDHIVNRPETFSSVEITFVVDPDNASADTAAPATTTEPDTTPAETTAPEASAPAASAPATTTPSAPAAPKTGIALAVVPAVMALAAVAVSKKH